MNKIFLIFGICLLVYGCSKDAESYSDYGNQIYINYEYPTDYKVLKNGTIWVKGQDGIYAIKNTKVKLFPIKLNGASNMAVNNNSIASICDISNSVLYSIENDSIILYSSDILKYTLSNISSISSVMEYDYNNMVLPLNNGILIGDLYFDRNKWSKIDFPNLTNINDASYQYIGDYVGSNFYISLSKTESNTNILVFDETNKKAKELVLGAGYELNSLQPIDSKGNLYMFKGEDISQINIFDGSETTIFTSIINADEFYSLFITQNDELFILARNINTQKVIVYNYMKKTTVTLNPQFSLGTNLNLFLQKNGTIWIGEKSGWQNSLTIKGFKPTGEDLITAGDIFNKMTEDDDGRLWFIGDGFNNLFFYSNGTMVRYEDFLYGYGY